MPIRCRRGRRRRGPQQANLPGRLLKGRARLVRRRKCVGEIAWNRAARSDDDDAPLCNGSKGSSSDPCDRFTLLSHTGTLRRMSQESTHVRQARSDEALECLTLLLAAMPEQERPALAAELAAELPRDGDSVSGLFRAEAGGQWIGVGLAQVHAGRTASIWRPRFHGEESAEVAGLLIRRCLESLAGQPIRVTQSLVEIDDVAAQWFLDAGFMRIARLAYLLWDAKRPDVAFDSSPLRFQTAVDVPLVCFAEVVQRSYEQTLDCPALNDVRAVDEVLEGYRAIGQHRPELWTLAYAGDEAVGCVLLSEDPGADHCELVYMGLAPTARGRDWGAKLIAEAQRQTVAMNRSRLVLAVDVANKPALVQYHRAGFRVWDQRDVFAITEPVPR
jgi:mycothiol synthase